MFSKHLEPRFLEVSASLGRLQGFLEKPSNLTAHQQESMFLAKESSDAGSGVETLAIDLGASRED